MQGIIVLIVYALLMVGATKAFTKREDGGESFHVGHRNMGMVVSAMSLRQPGYGRRLYSRRQRRPTRMALQGCSGF